MWRATIALAFFGCALAEKEVLNLFSNALQNADDKPADASFSVYWKEMGLPSLTNTNKYPSTFNGAYPHYFPYSNAHKPLYSSFSHTSPSQSLVPLSLNLNSLFLNPRYRQFSEKSQAFVDEEVDLGKIFPNAAVPKPSLYSGFDNTKLPYSSSYVDSSDLMPKKYLYYDVPNVSPYTVSPHQASYVSNLYGYPSSVQDNFSVPPNSFMSPLQSDLHLSPQTQDLLTSQYLSLLNKSKNSLQPGSIPVDNAICFSMDPKTKQTFPPNNELRCIFKWRTSKKSPLQLVPLSEGFLVASRQVNIKDKKKCKKGENCNKPCQENIPKKPKKPPPVTKKPLIQGSPKQTKTPTTTAAPTKKPKTSFIVGEPYDMTNLFPPRRTTTSKPKRPTSNTMTTDSPTGIKRKSATLESPRKRLKSEQSSSIDKNAFMRSLVLDGELSDFSGSLNFRRANRNKKTQLRAKKSRKDKKDRKKVKNTWKGGKKPKKNLRKSKHVKNNWKKLKNVSKKMKRNKKNLRPRKIKKGKKKPRYLVKKPKKPKIKTENAKPQKENNPKPQKSDVMPSSTIAVQN